VIPLDCGMKLIAFRQTARSIPANCPNAPIAQMGIGNRCPRKAPIMRLNIRSVLSGISADVD
jgi:hypothetical protein